MEPRRDDGDDDFRWGTSDITPEAAMEPRRDDGDDVRVRGNPIRDAEGRNGAPS